VLGSDTRRSAAERTSEWPGRRNGTDGVLGVIGVEACGRRISMISQEHYKGQAG